MFQNLGRAVDVPQHFTKHQDVGRPVCHVPESRLGAAGKGSLPLIPPCVSQFAHATAHADVISPSKRINVSASQRGGVRKSEGPDVAPPVVGFESHQ